MNPRRAPWVALLLFLVQAPMYADYVTDDSYIYARFADNLARLGELSFNPGEPVHAATSPLWAGLGAVGVLAGSESIEWLRWLGILCGAAAVFVLSRIAARLLFDRPLLTWAVVAVIATEPWLVRWSSSGMETPLAALLVAVALDATLRPVESVRWRRAALAVGLLPLVRPEGLLLVVLFGIHVLRAPRARGRVDLYLLALLPFVAWAVYALPVYGHVLPETMRAKSTPLGLQPGRFASNLLVMGQIFAVGAVVPAVVWFVGFVRRPRRVWTADTRFWAVPVWWQWSLGLPLIYLVRDVQVISRYLEVVLPAVIVLALILIGHEAHRRAWIHAFSLQALLAYGLTVSWIAPNANAFGSTLEEGLGDIAEYLREQTPPDATVAIYDIGLVGHRSERRVLDLGGLIHPGINALRDRVDDTTILRDGLFLEFGRPDYLVDRAYEPAVLEGGTIGDVRMRALLSRQVANLGLSRGRPVIYTLYAVEDR